MDDLQLLQDDHTFLSSHVIHVIALHRALVEGHFDAACLEMELRRQAQLLGQQLVEHFEFEERVAFVRLEERFADARAAVITFLAEHDDILRAFEEFRVGLDIEQNNRARGESLAAAERFLSVFEQHATAETRLFQELKVRILQRGVT